MPWVQGLHLGRGRADPRELPPCDLLGFIQKCRCWRLGQPARSPWSSRNQQPLPGAEPGPAAQHHLRSSQRDPLTGLVSTARGGEAEPWPLNLGLGEAKSDPPPLSARGHVPSMVPRARRGWDKAVRGLSTKQRRRHTRGPARLRREAGARARPDLPLQLANCSLLPVPAARGAGGRCYYLLPALICCNAASGDAGAVGAAGAGAGRRGARGAAKRPAPSLDEATCWGPALAWHWGGVQLLPAHSGGGGGVAAPQAFSIIRLHQAAAAIQGGPGMLTALSA